MKAATIETHPVLNGGPHAISAGPGAAMTVGAFDCAYLGRFDTGSATLASPPVILQQGQGGPFPCVPEDGIFGAVVGPDGKLYFTVSGSGPTAILGRVNPNASGLETVNNQGVAPLEITVGPDGNVWFTVNGPPGAVVKVVPSSFFTPVPYTTPAGVVGPRGVIAGPDGNLYVTGGEADVVWRVAPATGTFTPVGGAVDGPSFGEVGPDGNVWFTASEGGSLVRLVPSTGAITTFPIPGAPFDVAFGDDGKAYVTDGLSDVIRQVDPASGTLTATLDAPGSGMATAFIDEGPDGHLYAAGRHSNAVYEITPDAPPAQPDTTAPETTITKAPKKLKLKPGKKKAKASFEFLTNEPGSGFKCTLDKKPAAACSSPFKAKLKKGKHKFSVVATDPAGNPDPTPADAAVKVKRAKPKR